MTGAPSAILNVSGCKLNQLLKEKNRSTGNTNYTTLYALGCSINNNILSNDGKKRL